jgi:hypothetical protein
MVVEVFAPTIRLEAQKIERELKPLNCKNNISKDLDEAQAIQ